LSNPEKTVVSLPSNYLALMDAPERKGREGGDEHAEAKKQSGNQKRDGDKQEDKNKQPQTRTRAASTTAYRPKKKKDLLPPTTWERTLLRKITGLAWMSEPNYVPPPPTLNVF
jgi:hypothetical protein